MIFVFLAQVFINKTEYTQFIVDQEADGTPTVTGGQENLLWLIKSSFSSTGDVTVSIRLDFRYAAISTKAVTHCHLFIKQ